VKRGELPPEDDSMNSYTMNKGGKAWSEWWKKKRSNCEDLLMASESGDLERVKTLLDKEVSKDFVANIKFQGLDQFTALHFAAQENKVDVVRYLIDAGAHLEAKSSIGRTPLHLSSLKGHQEVVQILVDSGADPNWQDDGKKSWKQIIDIWIWNKIE